MTPQVVGIAFSLVLPIVAILAAVALLRRAIAPEQTTHWFAFAASGMVFAMASLWLTKSFKHLLLIPDAARATELQAWAAMNTMQGPYFCISLLMLTAGFYVYLLWKQRGTGR
jgi:hypothetical protein